MKRLFLLLIGACMLCGMHAQVLEKDESGLVYYSPKTSITLDFTYTVETYEPGIYAQYAEAMLGVTDAVKENKKVYRLKDVHIGTTTSTDYTRPHKVTTEGGIPILLSINEKGLLTGYNLPTGQEKKEVHRSHMTGDHKSSRAAKNHIAPYPEDVLKAATPMAQAHAVAKQIFHLRETRMYLLNGEVEHAPADGEAMKLVLEELDKQEQALTALFMGKKSKKTEHKKTAYNKISRQGAENDDVIKGLLFFSEENGFTNEDNIDADTITILICLNPVSYKPTVTEPKKSKKKGEELTSLTYNLPGNAVVKVRSKKGDLHRERTIPMAQLGIDVALPKSMFTGASLPVIVFDEKTGNIKSISK